ncbi:MAG TPA: VWA domain-containing protein [Pirellulaceae bacterium]|nr:VWA domain-containing protein [Pirellulaceae bacterium]
MFITDHISILAFWPFVSGVMLLWSLAALVPIVIHLWNRRQYRVVTWAAMEYLLAAMRKNSRRIVVEQWILLAVRTLILILFACALAQPLLSLIPALANSFGAPGQTHWVLVVDVSYSMAAQREGKTRFDLAKERAGQLVQGSQQGDGFTLVALGDAPQVIIRTPAFDPQDVLEEIDALRVQHGGARLASGLAEIETLVVSAQEKHRRLANTRVCFFSDLGRTTWDELTVEAVRTRIGRLAEKSVLVMFDVGDAQTQNSAITRLELRDSLVALGRETTLECDVQNFGSVPLAGQQVELHVDGRRTHTQTIESRAGAKVSTTFSYRFETPGEHRVEARLANDLLEVDNHRYLSLPVRESLQVLCVQGAPGEAKHLTIALEPGTSERPLVRASVAGESALVEQDLTKYDAIFLCNVGRFSRDDSAVLEQYVRQGGGLVLFLGDQVQAESYNEQLGSEKQGRLLPARLDALAPTGEYRLNPLEYRHPIVAVFEKHTRAGLLTTPVWKYMKLTPYDATKSRVALAFDTGDPAIITEPIGRGRVVLVATAASIQSQDRTTTPPTPWTALSTWPSFPPLVQETLAYAIAGQRAQRNLLVSDDLSGVLPGATSQQAVQLIAPGGHSERLQLKFAGDDAVWDYGDTHFSGVYEATLGPPRATSQLFAVNVNTRESDLARVDPETLPSQLSRDLPSESSPVAALAGGGHPAELFRYFLSAVLVLLVVETVLAWRFGSGAR